MKLYEVFAMHSERRQKLYLRKAIEILGIETEKDVRKMTVEELEEAIPLFVEDIEIPGSW